MLMKFANKIVNQLMIVGAAVTLSSLSVNAIEMTGGVAFGGVAILDNADPLLATQVSIPLAFGAAATGDFSPSIGVGTPIAFTSPLLFGVTSGIIWSGGAGPVFVFTATDPIAVVGADAVSLALTAAGFVDDGPGGFDPTPAEFTMAITKSAGTIGAFGSITIPAESVPGNSVPDSGSTALLLGCGIGLVGFCRQRVAV
jgi:hypothetical protein